MPLDMLTAVYHRPSGQTHLLAEPALEILQALAEPGSADVLLARLAERFDVGEIDGLAERIAELAEAGLIAPA